MSTLVTQLVALACAAVEAGAPGQGAVHARSAVSS